MWDLISNKMKYTALSVLSVIFILLYLLCGMVFPSVAISLESLKGYSKFVSYMTTYWLIIYLCLKFLGMAVWKVKFLSGFLDKHVGPDLRGQWHTSIQYTDSSGAVHTKTLKFIVGMSIFHFSMVMKSDDDYSISHVVSSKLLKDELLGGFVLYYTFESEVANPRSTDVGSFQGSAKLRVHSSSMMDGVYWTNRNWHNHLQTAGYIKLFRS